MFTALIIVSVIIFIMVYKYISNTDKSTIGGNCIDSSDCQTGLGCFNDKCLIPKNGSCGKSTEYCRYGLTCISGECLKFEPILPTNSILTSGIGVSSQKYNKFKFADGKSRSAKVKVPKFLKSKSSTKPKKRKFYSVHNMLINASKPKFKPKSKSKSTKVKVSKSSKVSILNTSDKSLTSIMVKSKKSTKVNVASLNSQVLLPIPKEDIKNKSYLYYNWGKNRKLVNPEFNIVDAYIYNETIYYTVLEDDKLRSSKIGTNGIHNTNDLISFKYNGSNVKLDGPVDIVLYDSDYNKLSNPIIYIISNNKVFSGKFLEKSNIINVKPVVIKGEKLDIFKVNDYIDVDRHQLIINTNGKYDYIKSSNTSNMIYIGPINEEISSFGYNEHLVRNDLTSDDYYYNDRNFKNQRISEYGDQGLLRFNKN